ncbi:hypothetical protein KIPB_003007 [Kipferlia bialata]|uniref:Protein kinase domain-containing protein n=1 Tax=Kipferlia bialata TaxID=797122 RepID=A0A9K3CTS4_9EUKA|nr:hypothetical protein KIPB_003007 [Kipferlia bialata]|eukprot:g3007.t1
MEETEEWEATKWGWPARKAAATHGSDSNLMCVRDYRLLMDPAYKSGAQRGREHRVTLPPGKTIVNVSADYLRFMVADIREKISSQYGDALTLDHVQWCMGVPARWSYQARIQMRLAAVEAGVVDVLDSPRLLLVPEAEAAITTLKSKVPAMRFTDGEVIMVVDAGSQTLDLTTHRLSKEDMTHHSLVEVSRAVSSFDEGVGSVATDSAFKDWVSSKLTDTVFERMMLERPQDVSQLLRCWQDIKQVVGTSSMDIEYLCIPTGVYMSLPESVLQSLEAEFKDVEDETNVELVLTADEAEKLFDPSVERVIGCIRGEVAKLQREDDTRVGSMVVVGGFAGSQYLSDRIKAVFGASTPIHCISEPGSAVLYGSVLEGLNTMSSPSKHTTAQRSTLPRNPRKHTATEAERARLEKERIHRILAPPERGFRSFSSSAALKASDVLKSLRGMDTSQVEFILSQLGKHVKAVRRIAGVLGPLATFLETHNPNTLDRVRVDPLVAEFYPLFRVYQSGIGDLRDVRVDVPEVTSLVTEWVDIVEQVASLTLFSTPASMVDLSYQDVLQMWDVEEYTAVVDDVYLEARDLIGRRDNLAATQIALRGITARRDLHRANRMQTQVTHMNQQLRFRIQEEASMRGIIASLTAVPATSQRRRGEVSTRLQAAEVEVLMNPDPGRRRDQCIAVRDRLLAQQQAVQKNEAERASLLEQLQVHENHPEAAEVLFMGALDVDMEDLGFIDDPNGLPEEEVSLPLGGVYPHVPFIAVVSPERHRVIKESIDTSRRMSLSSVFEPFNTEADKDIDNPDRLGAGDFGAVFRARKRDDTGYPRGVYAVKLQDMNMFRPNLSTREVKRNVDREILAGEFRVANSPYVVKCYDHFINSDRPQTETEMVIVMDLLSGQPFDDVLNVSYPDRCAERPLPHMLSIMEKLLLGLRDLEIQKVIHRDLKPENIMVDVSGEDADVHIIDLGLCKPLSCQEDLTHSVNVGNILYRAPECYPKSAHCSYGSVPTADNKPQYGTKADHFSAGLIFNEMVQRDWVLSTVRSEMDLHGMYSAGIANLTDDETGIPGLASIINSMVQIDPRQRRSLDRLLGEMGNVRSVVEGGHTQPRVQEHRSLVSLTTATLAPSIHAQTELDSSITSGRQDTLSGETEVALAESSMPPGRLSVYSMDMSGEDSEVLIHYMKTLQKLDRGSMGPQERGLYEGAVERLGQQEMSSSAKIQFMQFL